MHPRQNTSQSSQQEQSPEDHDCTAVAILARAVGLGLVVPQRCRFALEAARDDRSTYSVPSGARFSGARRMNSASGAPPSRQLDPALVSARSGIMLHRLLIHCQAQPVPSCSRCSVHRAPHAATSAVQCARHSAAAWVAAGLQL